ncbi:MAG TPA: insulinase family protein [Candidatus Eremiobacteraceae bacterium]
MRNRSLTLTIATCVAWIALIGAAPVLPPSSFQTAAMERLPNGTTIVSQPTGGALVAVEVVVPVGLAQQTAANAGIAGVAAQLVLSTPIDGGATLADAAAAVGATVTYTLDPLDTRFYLEAQAPQFGHLLHGLVTAINAPDLRGFSAARAAALASASTAGDGPAIAALDMLRQVTYAGTGYSYPDAGRQISLSKLTASDASTFASSYRTGPSTIVALEGAVDSAVMSTVRSEFGKVATPGGRVRLFSSATNAQPTTKAQPPSTRGHEVVTHRAVSAPWVAVGYPAPGMYASDYPVMLVIEALLGRGGDVHSFSLGSANSLPDEFAGAYYQFEAQPGMLAIFLNGSDTSVDTAVRDLQSAVNRLRSTTLSDAIVDHGRRLAVGQYFASVSTLGDAAWLLGRSAASPDGPNFENLVPVRIARVSAADIQRVARHYLTGEILGIVLPQTSTQQ